MSVDVSGQRHFQTLQKQNPNNAVVDLVCLHDGTVVEFIDEGPFPVMDGKAVSGWEGIPPSIGRQRLLTQLAKRDGAGNPLWLATKPGVRVWDRDIKRFIDVPVMGPQYDEAKAAHAKLHDDRAKAGRVMREAEEKKAKEAAAATEQVVVSALSKLIGKAEAPAKAPAKKDGGA